MDQSNLVGIMTAAVVVSAIGVLIQTIILVALYKVAKNAQSTLAEVKPKVEGLMLTSADILKETRSGLAEIREKSNRLLDAGQRHSDQIHALLGDVTDRSRRQLDHAEMLVSDTLSRIEDTVALLHKGVLKPIKTANGLVAGVRTAAQFLMKGNRPNPDQVTVDEEMFI